MTEADFVLNVERIDERSRIRHDEPREVCILAAIISIRICS